VLHHLPRPLRHRFAQEIRRVLRADGRALVVDFATGRDRGSLLGHFHRHGHVDPAAITSLLTEAGLRPVRSGSVGIQQPAVRARVTFCVTRCLATRCTDAGGSASSLWRR
jgi:hypothetical protein